VKQRRRSATDATRLSSSKSGGRYAVSHAQRSSPPLCPLGARETIQWRAGSASQPFA
jgi:hypothetical protein